MDLILTSLPGQFQEIHSPDKLSDHDVISGTLKIHIPPPQEKKKKKKPRRKAFLYQKGNFESMRKDASDFGLNIFYFEKILCTTYIVIISIH